MLIFILPEGNSNGPISVTTPHGSASSSTSFGNSISGLSISGIWPGTGSSAGDFVFVFGSDFIQPLSVSIGSINIPVVQVVNADMLIFIMPQNSTTGIITITTDTGNISSTESYPVIN